MTWRCTITRAEAPIRGSAYFAKHRWTDEMRKLCEVGERDLFGGQLSEDLSDTNARVTSHAFDLDDLETLYVMTPCRSKPRVIESPDEPDYEAMWNDRAEARHANWERILP